MDIYSFVFLFVFIPSFLFFNKISVQSFVFVILWFSINCLFDFFLYEKRPVSLRRSFRFSTMIVLFLYESFSACFQYFTPAFSPSASSFLFCQNLSRFILSISFFLFPFYLSLFFLSRASICARIYYNVFLFFSFFPCFFFYVLQHLCKSASYKKDFFLFQNNS